MLIMMMAFKGIQGAQHDSSFVEDLRVPSAGVPGFFFTTFLVVKLKDIQNWLALPVGNEGPSTFTGWYIGDS